MKKFWLWSVAALLLACAIHVGADTKGFFRISSSGEATITDFRSDGTVVWSNAVVGSTGRIQRTDALSSTNGSWTDAHSFTATVAVMTTTLPVNRIPAGMVLVPGGTLPDIGNGVITVDSFYIGKTEVTWGEWQAVRTWAATNGYDIGGAGAGCASNHPVHTVNWYNVVKWCNARSEMEGWTPAYTVGGSVYTNGQNNDVAVNAAANGYRLPTDPEWEFAARGGTLSQGYEYSGGNDVNAVAWYRDNSGGAACNYWDGLGTWPVGQKGANELGIHDMIGNVWEWCFDWHPSYVGSHRVFRGGGWGNDANLCRVGDRDFDPPDDAYFYGGFRVVLPPDQPLIPTRIIRLVGDLDFGEVAAGYTATRLLTIHNDGNTTLAVTNIAYPAGFSGTFGGTIAAGGTQTVTIGFSPVATQAYGGTLTVHSDATAGTATHPLGGTGNTASRVIRLDGDLAFSPVPVGESVTRTLRIYNDGNAPLAVMGVFYPAGFRGPFSGTIDARESREVSVTFSPTATQSYGGTLTLNSDASGGTIAHPLSGTGIPATRVIRLSGELAFGSVLVGQTAARTLTIYNDGNAPLMVTNIAYPTGYSGPWSGSIASHGSQNVPVTFSPVSTQAYDGTLTVNSDMTQGTNTYSLSGMGIPATRVIRLSGDLAFDSVVVSQTITRTFTIYNDGNAPLTVTNITYPTGYSGPWNGSIAATGSQAVAVTFSPVSTQAYDGTLTVNSDSTGGRNTIQLSGMGMPLSTMVLIPGGTNSGVDPEFGTYNLTATSFYMDKYEVTKALWDDVYAWAITNGYRFDNAGLGKAANHPVHTVNWYDVVKWCNARSQKEGRPAVYTVNGAVYKAGQSNDVVQTSVAGYRLPTDVEWEYAARGGAASRRFPWGDSDEIQHARANYYSWDGYSYDTSSTREYHPAYNDGIYPYTSSIGSFAANGYGLHDMAGNLWEWCFDWYPGFEGSYRGLRGGSWNDYAYYCLVGYRSNDGPCGGSTDYGFRAVLPPGQQ